ncbi:MAG: DEAD/DEAH box helicase family protein [Acidimicrobiaceae bacterium]|nr:DEAD/DEAH box helicase family protein [Acidimicrobiaceae bacterium]
MLPAQFDPAVDPILCSPYAEPDKHWELDAAGRAMSGVKPKDGRRASALLRPVPDDHKTAQLAMDMETVVGNEAVEAIRHRVGEWRSEGYPGTTSITRKLLAHWAEDDSHRQHRPFFAQREAIETLIWLREAARRDAPERRRIEEQARSVNDGLVRYCSKMATGTGKTAVMGMLIAWQTLNAVRTRRQRSLRHSSRFLVLAPGLTVRDRLAVLAPSHPENIYRDLGLVPGNLFHDLNAAQVEIVNWQAFRRRDPSEATGAQKALLGSQRVEQTETQEAMMRRVVAGLLQAGSAPGDLVVINDEAHHCYLPQTTANLSTEEKDSDKIAAVWFNAVRALRDMGALGKLDADGAQASPVYDFSATPMWLARANRGESPMFEWVTSDFSLMDAIESGLVKVPRVPVDDDTDTASTAWRRLYEATQRKKLPKRSTEPTITLPEPLEGALTASVREWRNTFERTDGRQPTPPVMIVVANTVANAEALYEHIAGYETPDGRLFEGRFDEFSNVTAGVEGSAPRWRTAPRTLLVHSRLDDDDAVGARFSKLLREQAARMGEEAPADAVREALNTVGKSGRLGAGVRCVVSVSMLTEGWDARTVTQILGFRAFSSQLLCEQVTGRALRRTSYDSFRDEPDKKGLLAPEYAEVLGIPFEFMPARGAGPSPKPPSRSEVETVPGRSSLRIIWPQVMDYLTVAGASGFRLDPERVVPAALSADAEAEIVEVAGVSGEIGLMSTDEDQRDKAARMRCAAEIANLLTAGSDEAPQSGIEARTPQPTGLRDGGRAALFASAFQAVGDWLAHPDVDCERAAVLLRHREKRNHYNDLIAACRFAPKTPPPPADCLARFACLQRHSRRAFLDHAAAHPRMRAQRTVARGVPLTP